MYKAALKGRIESLLFPIHILRYTQNRFSLPDNEAFLYQDDT